MLIGTCCCVKALRPKPWKKDVGGFWKRGRGPKRVDRKGGGSGSGIGQWPGVVMERQEQRRMERQMESGRAWPGRVPERERGSGF